MVKSLHQSTTHPLALNTITVSLSSNVQLGGGLAAQITLSGLKLTGTSDADSSSNVRTITDLPIETGDIQSVISASSFVLASTASNKASFYVGYDVTVCCDGGGAGSTKPVLSYTSGRVLTIDNSGGGFGFTPVAGSSTYEIFSGANTIFGTTATSWTQ
eukprot:2478145-Rhodomonas_salina.1